jgi:4-amino-4-deoxy-L-arabinose transferase-like glycosyltransferase
MIQQETPLYKQKIFWLITFLWITATLSNLIFYPFLNYIDQPHYLGVAWEMFRSHTYLFPTSAGIADNNKPPFLYWLIISGWHLFGISIWWPRLLEIIFSWICIQQTAQLTRKISQSNQAEWTCFLLLYGGYYWLNSTSAIRFDLPCAAFTMVAINGLWKMAHTNRIKDMLLFASGLTLSLFSKGPLAIIYILPIILFVPLIKKNIPTLKWHIHCTTGLILSFILPIIYLLIVQHTLTSSNVQHSVTSKIGSYLALHWHLTSVLAKHIIILMPWALLPGIYVAIGKTLKQKFKEKLLFLIFPVITNILFFALLTHINKSRYFLPAGLLLTALAAIALTQYIPKTKRFKLFFSTPHAITLFIGVMAFCLLPIWRNQLSYNDFFLIYISTFSILPLGILLIYQIYCRSFSIEKQVQHTSIIAMLIWITLQAFIMHPIQQHLSMSKSLFITNALRKRHIPVLNTATALHHEHIEYFLRSKQAQLPITNQKGITQWCKLNKKGYLLLISNLKSADFFKKTYYWTPFSTLFGNHHNHSGIKTLHTIGLCSCNNFIKGNCPQREQSAKTA